MTEPTWTWRRSSHSDCADGCMELADAGDKIILRSSRNPDEVSFRFDRLEIAGLIAGVKAGEFDDLID